MRNNIKALDMLAIDPSGTAWMIEVKDYTRMPIGRDDRPDAKDLGQIVSDKVFDTLAAILPASVNAADADEKSFAIAMTSASRLRVVLHLEQPASRSRLWPRPIDPAHIKQSLKQRLKPVDRHPVVASMGQLSSLAWAVDRA